MAEMTDGQLLSQGELHQRLLGTLSRFADYCDEHGLRYSMVGGTMLGAVRHKGFIPWDDDIDVGMPRPDYEELVKQKDLFEQETGLFLRGIRTLPITASPHLKIEDPSVIIEEYGGDIKVNLWLDLLAVDGLPDNQKTVDVTYKLAAFGRKVLVFLNLPATRYSSGLGKIAKKIIADPLREHVPFVERSVGRMLMRLDKRVPYGTTKSVGIISFGRYGAGERIPLEGVENMTRFQFEGCDFSAFSCWDEYLKGIYGDYMRMPDEKDRHVHHAKARLVDREKQ